MRLFGIGKIRSNCCGYESAVFKMQKFEDEKVRSRGYRDTKMVGDSISI